MSDMRSRMHNQVFLTSLLSLIAFAFLAAGCSGGSGSNNTPVTPAVSTGPAFVIGTDAPVASVVSFAVQVQSIDAIDGSGNSVSLISGMPTVDFARYNGLQTLLDMNDVPVGTYNSVAITLGAGTIGYLNTQTGGAPAIATEPATFTQSVINVTLTKPLVVAKAGAPVGLRVDFDLRKSIQVDSTGQITDQVTPTFDVTPVGRNDSGGYIDEFIAAVVSVNSDGQSFVVQGPHGEQFTINVNGQTEWDNNESISDLTTSSIVQVSGILDAADQTLDADEVAILSQDGFYAAGPVTYVQPASGTANSFDLYVSGLLPTTTSVQLGQIAQVDLNGDEKFLIYWMHNPLTQFLFNSGSVLAGQDVAVGGPASGAANAQAVTIKRVSLRQWGYNGTVVAGSRNMQYGTFQMQINGFAGLLVPQTVTVYTAGRTAFRYGLNGMSDVTGNVRVVGLLLKVPGSGQTVLLARYIDALP